MSTNVVINSNVDVVELHSNTDLTLESNTQIMFSTNNILINYIPFDEYIRKVVFDTEITTNLNSSDVHSWENAVDVPTPNNKINLTNNTSELIVDELHCSGISATHSHVNSKYHYINLSAAHNIYIKNNQNSTNVVYNKVDNQQLYSLSNYIYNVINTLLSHTPDALTPESLTIPSPSGRTNISSLGMYIGNRIVTSNISTTSVLDGSDNEPVLEFDSQTAVNFVTDVFNTPGDVNAGSNILFGSLSLDSLVKSQLDETGLLDLQVTLSSGQNIGMTINTFSNGGISVFNYTVVFRLYEHPTGTTLNLGNSPHPFSLEVSIPSQVSNSFTLGDGTHPLEAGKFYTVVATFTNTRTGTVVENVILEPRSVPTIEFITGLSAEVVDEDRLRVSFNNHATVVSGVTVNFNVIIRWDLNEVTYQPDPIVSHSLNGPTEIIINIPVNQITGYETNVLDNTAYEFQIETTGQFTILNDSIVSISHDFIDPNTPTGLTFNGTSFTWSHTSQSKITNVYYDVYKSTTLIGTTYVNTESFTASYASPTIISSINLNSQRNTRNGLIPDTYKVRARHAYGSSSYATLTVNPLSITTLFLSLSHNKMINISYTITNNNGNYSISSNKSLSNNLYFTVSNPSSSQESHSVWVQVKDSFGLQMRSSDASITVYRPTIILGSLSYVTGSTREYISSVSITGNTTTIRSISYATLVGMTFVSKTTSEIIFQLNNTDQNSITVSANITVEDEYGFQNSIVLSETINIAYTTGISTTPSYNTGTRVLSFQTSGLTYKWYKDTVIMNDEKGQTITISNQNFGIIHCVATETLTNGFTRDIQGDDFNNQEPTISGGSFTGINLSADPIYQFSLTLGFNTTEKDVVMYPTLFNGAGIYTLTGTYKNNYDLQKIITIGTFTATAPTIPSITSATSVSYDSMTINYSLGNDGNPSVTPSTITLFYGISSGSEDNYLSLSSGSTSTNITGLLVGTTYYFTIEKDYQHYNIISSSPFDEKTLDYQYDSEELVRLTLQSGGFFGMTDDEDKLYVYSLLDGPIRISESVLSGRIKSVYRGDNRPYDKLQISIWDVPEKRILLEKGAGNNVFYIVFDGNYLSYDSSSSALTTSSVKDSTCKFIIEAFPFTYTDNKFQDQQYNLDNYKAYLEPTNNTRLF